MRRAIVARLQGSAAPEVARRASRLVGATGNIAEQLMALGFASRDVLDACSAVTGLSLAPTNWVQRAVFLDSADDRALCIQLGAAPFSLGPGRLGIVYADPIVATSHDALGFPLHTAFVGAAPDVESVLARSPPAFGAPSTSVVVAGDMTVDDMTLPASALAALPSWSAPPADEDAATLDERRAPKNKKPPPTSPPTPLSPSPTRAAPPSSRTSSTSTVSVPPRAFDSQGFELPRFEPSVVVDDDNATMQLDEPAAPGALPSSEMQAAPTFLFDDVTVPVQSLPARVAATLQEPAAAAPMPAPSPRTFMGPLDPVLPPQSAPSTSTTKKRRRPPTALVAADAVAPVVITAADVGRPIPRVVFFLTGAGAFVVTIVIAGAIVFAAHKKQPAAPPAHIAVVTADGSVDTNGRQQSLTRLALTETNPARVLDLLTRAIDIDPLSTAGRAAQLERARRYRAAGQLERARRDLERLVPKASEPERAVVVPLLAEVEAQIKANALTTPPPPPPPPTTTPEP